MARQTLCHLNKNLQIWDIFLERFATCFWLRVHNAGSRMQKIYLPSIKLNLCSVMVNCIVDFFQPQRLSPTCRRRSTLATSTFQNRKLRELLHRPQPNHSPSHTQWNEGGGVIICDKNAQRGYQSRKKKRIFPPSLSLSLP